MNARVLAATCVVSFAWLATVTAGEIYTISSTDGKKTVQYELSFGSGKSGQVVWQAFCPEQKKFVSLYWQPGKNDPKPVSSFWDHRTGETVKLYKFPDCASPLPAITDVKDIEVFPVTGDKKFKVAKTGNWD